VKAPAIALLLSLACTRACPAERERDLLGAVEDWEQGRLALKQGDATQALARFESAAAADPDSPTLVAWQAHALEALDREDEALTRLSEALERFPEDGDLRFNRAALRARAGQLDGAAADLLILSSQGRLDAQQASADPDLARLRERPDLAAIVAPPRLEVELSGSSGRVLLGDAWELSLLLETAEGAAVDIRDMGEAPRLLRRTRVVEDRLASRPGRALRRLETSWQAVEPGQGTLGPWLLSSAGSSALTEPLAVEVLELGARSGSLGRASPEALILPGELLADRQPPWLGRIGEDLVLYLPSLARAEVEVQGQVLLPREEWELREQSQPVARALVYDPPASARIRVLSPGAPALDWSWPSAP